MVKNGYMIVAMRGNMIVNESKTLDSLDKKTEWKIAHYRMVRKLRHIKVSWINHSLGINLRNTYAKIVQLM